MTQLAARKTGGVMKITVSTGGSSYSSPPTVTITGGGGTGASAVAHMAGTAVQSIVVTNAGTGYTSNPTVSITGGSGSGAAATATAYTGSLVPMTFFKGRYSDMYGVDGMGRGLRWDGAGTTAEQIGLVKPGAVPAVTASSTGGSGGRVTAIQVVNQGVGYTRAPTVAFTGGSPSSPAKALASIVNGRVSAITITDPGSGYQDNPTVSISGGLGSGVSLNVGVIGSVYAVDITNSGSGYISNATTFPSVVFSSGQGLAGVNAEAEATNGRISSINILAAGTGATTAVTASIVGGGGTGAVVSVRMRYSVASVTASSSGSGFFTPPVITFRAATGDSLGSGAAATALVNTTGNVTGVTVYSGGEYYDKPQALILDSAAKATATFAQALRGKYKCCIRYIDDTPESQNGPIPSSISDIVEVDAGDSSQVLTWTFSHPYLDDRVSAMELYRTTTGQSIVFFRVATIQRTDAAFTSTYTDTIADDDLKNPTRNGYGLMPLTLPSGQINARRFEVPPPEFSVGAMFQDRAWYAVDTTGLRPNSLLYSEVDEPESVPAENEIVVQENTGSPDKIVALIPLGSMLLVAQQSHLYQLTYVAQPVIDASVMLAAYRGILNARCWDTMGGVAFIVDGTGMYGFDGQREEPLSVAVDNYWRDGIIDFTKASQFHVRADTATRVVRFYYCRPADSAPTRALCYCITTQAWWEEQYASAITATSPTMESGRRVILTGTSSGGFLKESGNTDSGTPVPYSFRSGNFPLADEQGSRSVSLIYRPTESDSDLNLRLHYNDSQTPRANAISSDRGTGFSVTAGSTAAVLNMKRSRSALGDSTGFARAYYAGRVDDRSSGGDRHIAVAIAGPQAGTSSSDRVIVHGIAIEGAK